MEAVRRLYENYLEEYHTLQRRRKFGDGMLGMGKAPERELCHTRFSQDIQALLEGPDVAALSPGEAAELLRYICFAPLEESSGSEAHWMLLAVHSMADGLVSRLEGGQARELYEAFSKAYPRRMRLPAQDHLLSALKAQSQSA